MPAASAKGLERRSLSQRVTELLREMIRAGELRSPFPGEITLAARVGVSRPVLRDALRELARQKIIETTKGKRTRLLPARRAVARARKLHILAVSSPRTGTTLRLAVGAVHEVREILQGKGYVWSEFREGRFAHGEGRKSLSDRIRAGAYDCIALHDSTKAQQEWISRCKAPAFILGSAFPGVDLPSLDSDYHALGWHAAGKLAAAGHTGVAALLRSPARQGDEATLEGMRDFFNKNPSRTLTTHFFSGEVDEICRQLDRTLRSKNPPSALMLFYPVDVITVLTHLLQSGRRIPGDVALLSRESLPIMQAMVPAVTRYESQEARLVRRAVQALESLCHAQALKERHARIIPRFVPGQTL